jgi:hypothetical protein
MPAWWGLWLPVLYGLILAVRRWLWPDHAFPTPAVVRVESDAERLEGWLRAMAALAEGSVAVIRPPDGSEPDLVVTRLSAILGFDCLDRDDGRPGVRMRLRAGGFEADGPPS